VTGCKESEHESAGFSKEDMP